MIKRRDHESFMGGGGDEDSVSDLALLVRSGAAEKFRRVWSATQLGK